MHFIITSGFGYYQDSIKFVIPTIF